MSHAPTIPEGLQAIDAELREVEWLGHPPPAPTDRATLAVDLVLVLGGAALGACLYLLAWV